MTKVLFSDIYTNLHNESTFSLQIDIKNILLFKTIFYREPHFFLGKKNQTPPYKQVSISGPGGAFCHFFEKNWIFPPPPGPEFENFSMGGCLKRNRMKSYQKKNTQPPIKKCLTIFTTITHVYRVLIVTFLLRQYILGARPSNSCKCCKKQCDVLYVKRKL